ncbi:MAG: fibro-slime domain-containing protein [Phycisphaerales bacterium]|nr:MAG: fibro-slime domain-containing protein [Phycisphaerales bacterium]
MQMHFQRNSGFATGPALFGAALGMFFCPPQFAAADEPPESIEVEGIVRDFIEAYQPGGHPDFEHQHTDSYGHCSGNVALTLGEDANPVFTGKGGMVARQWRDSKYRPICYALYDPDKDNVEGLFSLDSTSGITSAETFDQWFNDVPGVNMSMPLTVTFQRQSDGTYVYDDKLDPRYAPLKGFFPIDDQLFGNSGGLPDHNFHFTFEMHLQFVYDEKADQYIKFIGDDDVWIFVDGGLVMDLGGIHAAHDQYVEIQRLGLEDGQTYPIAFFFAERHRTVSNFRLETNMVVENGSTPAVTAAFD